MGRDGKAVLEILCFYGLLECLGITCPIKWLTGCSCAGCGMSRAWLSVLRLDFAAAFGYHPLFWMSAVVCVCLLMGERLTPLLRSAGAAICIVCFLAVYFWRLSDPNDSIVVFQPNQGAIPRAFGYMFAWFRQRFL